MHIPQPPNTKSHMGSMPMFPTEGILRWGDCKFKITLNYMVSSRPSCDTGGPVWKQTNKEQPPPQTTKQNQKHRGDYKRSGKE